MFLLSRNFLKFAAAGAFGVLTVSGTPTCADEMAQNLGPGPHEPLIATVGSKPCGLSSESLGAGRSGPPPGKGSSVRLSRSIADLAIRCP
jgi:hypothetical protein